MRIELPKDAEGREIPLDTVALYDDDGNVYSVRRFIYTTDFDLGDKWMNSWYIVVDDYKTAKPEQMHLTSPDSWEKLEDDLDKAAHARYVLCAYFGKEPHDCDFCKANGICDCRAVVMHDIASRIRKLRGES